MPTTMSRRGLLARLPSVAATLMVPAGATALTDVPTAAAAAADCSPAAVLKRAEYVVELLRNHIRDRPPWEWAIDDELAERMLTWIRDWAAGKASEEDEGYDDLVEFCYTHGKLFVWIMLGDPVALIAHAALQSERSRVCRLAQSMAAVENLGGPPVPWRERLQEAKELPTYEEYRAADPAA